MKTEILVLFLAGVLVYGQPFGFGGTVGIALGALEDLDDDVDIPLEIGDKAKDCDESDEGEKPEKDDDNKIEPDSEKKPEEPQWDCSDSTFNVLKCILKGNGTGPVTKAVIFKATSGNMVIPSKPPKGFPVSDEAVIKIEGSLEDFLIKFQGLLKSTIDIIKDAFN